MISLNIGFEHRKHVVLDVVLDVVLLFRTFWHTAYVVYAFMSWDFHPGQSKIRRQ